MIDKSDRFQGLFRKLIQYGVRTFSAKVAVFGGRNEAALSAPTLVIFCCVSGVLSPAARSL